MDGVKQFEWRPGGEFGKTSLRKSKLARCSLSADVEDIAAAKVDDQDDAERGRIERYTLISCNCRSIKSGSLKAIKYCHNVSNNWLIVVNH